MTNRQVAAAATRKKLIDTTDQLIRKKGYDSISVEDITKASGVAKGTFYNYFKKKEDIIQALTQSHLSDLTAQIPKLGNQDPQDSIRHYLNAYLQVVVDSDVQLARQWIRYIVEPTNHQKWEFDLGSLEQLLTNLVQEGRLSAATPVTPLAQLLTTEIYGLVFSWCISPETIDPLKDINTFCDLQLAAILKDYLTKTSE
ncbi:TetR/AcrR family transcriptional regulator [Levilactobacillus acidifarinae]|uniref:HTH tetR-type domain-containing protein n=1 Tax=Levilactobacillus acidifarinae DSM 19394 = JCM 15949 TaxID=1423715 RepID=A0A0R1LQQ5_9LACO|nr:TetR/AcrR family transcriptional regulator [Levilactobacillus acidifarinae]KRK94570.1 hypothetical protein FD25_GL000540 [Levilactobacillus acidifarinae DSM 19394]GEO68322.1 TetR family transcriptional regulator [Levilactobacillus acidifarinae]